jgi:hypothetical protein
MTSRTRLAGCSYAIVVRELAAWNLTPLEIAVALERVRLDFEAVIEQALLEWRDRPCTREVCVTLPRARSKAERAGNSAFREVLEELLPTVKWEVADR